MSRDFRDVELWTAPDGARLALRRQAAEPSPRGACILVHGFGDHAGRYAHVARWLAERGLATFALDQRGSGRTPGPRGHVSRFAQYLGDLVGLRRLVQAEAPGPLVLLGHSHGGLIVLRYLESAPQGLAGAIITSPLVGLSMPVPKWKLLLARVLADLKPSLPIPTGMNLDDLSTSKDVVVAVRGDADCHQVMSPRAYFEMLAAQRAVFEESDRIAVPVFFALAGEDRICSTEASRRLAKRLTGEVTLCEYAGCFHEILQEPCGKRVLADAGAWLEREMSRAA